MKTFTFLSWITGFLITVAVLLLSAFPDFTTFNGFIYLLMMLVLMCVCVVGALLDYPFTRTLKFRW
jgi:cytochrome bd-type quinol oxidase subunit 2